MKFASFLLCLAVGTWAQTPPAAPAKKTSGTAPTASTLPTEPGLYAVFNTSMGTITAKLFEKETPVTVRNFVALARGTKAWKDPKSGAMVAKPLFNGITFHRVIPNFMIQTGDPTGTGSADCGYTIADEIVPALKFDGPGKLGMANTGSKHTGACQFFITEVAYPSLNGGYTLFGQVVDGQDVVGKISHVPRDANDKPRTPVKLVSVTIKRVGPPPAPAPAAKKSATPAKTAPKK
jgi:peptidyl-prolyl cis-trans isomerase A (cyclophilin A)